MELPYSDIYGLELEYTGNHYSEEVVLTEEHFLEHEDENNTAILEILDTGISERDAVEGDEWDRPEPGEEFSYLEKAAAHAYASTTVTGFRLLESGLKTTFRTLEFLARRS